MSDAGGPYLLDVGPIALAHTDAPVRDAALSYVQDTILSPAEFEEVNEVLDS